MQAVSARHTVALSILVLYFKTFFTKPDFITVVPIECGILFLHISSYAARILLVGY